MKKFNKKTLKELNKEFSKLGKKYGISLCFEQVFFTDQVFHGEVHGVAKDSTGKIPTFSKALDAANGFNSIIL